MRPRLKLRLNKSARPKLKSSSKEMQLLSKLEEAANEYDTCDTGGWEAIKTAGAKLKTAVKELREFREQD